MGAAVTVRGMARPRRRSARSPAQPGLGSMLADGIRARGRFHRLNHDVAVRHAARPTGEIVAELRTYADSRRLPVVTNYRNILFDVLVHAQDIAIPLGRNHPMPSEPARAGADRVWTMGWPFWARHRLRGVRLLATDTDWSAGAGRTAGADHDASAAADRPHHDGVAPSVRPGRAHDHRALALPRVLSPEDGTKDAFQPDQG